MALTDLSSMAIMTELKVTDILTADAHFQQVGLGFRTLPE
jgi:predicted nucleic acid-binding protein